VGFVKKPINAVIDTINWLIDKINNISFEIPDWVPEWAGGGKTFGINIPKIPNFALGTSYFQGGLARINERGGEIVNLPNGSQVIPADKSEKLLESRRGGVTVYVTIQGNVIGTNEFINQVGHVIAEEVQLAIGNV
jgi:phage-related protein